MRIRELTRRYGSAQVPAWPLMWASAYGPGRTVPTAGGGVLARVDRLGDRLSLTTREGDREHVGSLQWDAPPGVAEVEAVLKAHLGATIDSVGDLDIPAQPPGSKSPDEG